MFLQVEYVEADPEWYALPLTVASGGQAERLRESGLAEIGLADGSPHGLLGEAFALPAFARALLELLRNRGRLRLPRGEIEATRTAALRQILNDEALPDPVIHNTAEGNAAVIFGGKLALKFFRRVVADINPELEIGRHLTGQGFPNCPPTLGALEYRSQDYPPMTLAVARAFVPQAKNGWEFTLDAIGRYYEQVVAEVAQGHLPPTTSAEVTDHVGTYLESARLLGVRTAELHLALASGAPGSEFSVEPMTPPSLRGLFQSMRSLALKNLRLLRRQIKSLPPDLAPVAQRVLELEPVILHHYGQLIGPRFAAGRIRIHGDCQLRRVLWTGRDFVFPDFEGDATKPISERRIKRSPLRDTARMLRSFHHATYAGFHQQAERGVISPETLPKFEPWVRHWNRAVSRAYLQAYCQSLRPSAILPGEEDKLHIMLVAYLLDQVMDELGDELQLHSDNVRAPLQAIIHLTDEQTLLHLTGAAGAKDSGQ